MLKKGLNMSFCGMIFSSWWVWWKFLIILWFSIFSIFVFGWINLVSEEIKVVFLVLFWLSNLKNLFLLILSDILVSVCSELKFLMILIMEIVVIIMFFKLGEEVW